MAELDSPIYEDVTPKPEHLIKSISEQGYSFEAALADLIDNCISAQAQNVEILIDQDNEPYTLFLADDGVGMTEEILKKSLQFPSDSPDSLRGKTDLGRFGLGLKTASFSQSRRFTVISKAKETEKFNARTWDVDLLKQGDWLLKVNTDAEIEEMLRLYKALSTSYVNNLSNFDPNTIVVWHGLYKFESYINKKYRKKALQNEISETTSDHLSLVFHRFMEQRENALRIRVNNLELKPFNPFPTKEKDVRPIEFRQRAFSNDSISIEGFVLPVRAIEESKSRDNPWTTTHLGLLDMEGVYVYRAGRIISFGGWSGLIRKTPRLQLARMRVEIGNQVDNLLHLNVAKSQVKIPHELRSGFETYVEDLKSEAIKEFYNRDIKKFRNIGEEKASFFERRATNKGLVLEPNKEFPILKSLTSELNGDQKALLNTLMRLMFTKLNSIRKTHEDTPFIELQSDTTSLSSSDLLVSIRSLLKSGIDRSMIKNDVLPNLGFRLESLPAEVLEILEEKN